MLYILRPFFYPSVSQQKRLLAFAASALRSEAFRCQSYTGKGIGRQGIGSFCKEIPCSSIMACRHTPLLVHF